jgi:TRAP-type transport system periplasmic protein
MKKTILAALVLGTMIASLSVVAQTPEKPLKLRYAHMNPPNSPAGLQAQYFADKITERTKGAVQITVYPSSQLGSISEMAEQVSMGTVAMHHNTYGGLQPLLEELGLFDTPYLYRDIEHLLAATDPEKSVVLKELNKKLIETRNVRVLYSFYFGTRDLTTNRAVLAPKDLAGMKIRAIPSPIYQAAVEGMGAVAVPIDWAEVPVALSTGVADGQENPVSTIATSKLYEVQKFLMQTHHIMGSEPVLINEKVWQKLSPENKKIFQSVAVETRNWISDSIRGNEAKDLQTLKDKGMKIIGTADGLKIDEFRSSVNAVVDKRFGDKWGKYYSQIKAIK